MPAPLDHPDTRVNWRVYTQDLEAIELVHGRGNVNAVVRVLLAEYAKRLRVGQGAGAMALAAQGVADGSGEVEGA